MIKRLKNPAVAAFIFLLAVCAAGVSAEDAKAPKTKAPNSAAPAKTPAKQKSPFADFRSWKPINPEPKKMEAKALTACAPPPPPGTLDNSHEGGFINVYVNETGRNEYLAEDSPPLPEGTVIVKEKMQKKDGKGWRELGIMVKREKGFAPETGDWQFLFVDRKNKAVDQAAKLENCATCHKMREKEDYVFRKIVEEQPAIVAAGGTNNGKTDRKQVSIAVKEFGLTFQPPKGLIREHEDVPAKNAKDEFYSLIVSLADDPKIRERDIKAPSRSFRIVGVMSETSELTPEGQLAMAKSFGLPKDAVYSKDADFKVGGIPAKRLEYRENSRDDPENWVTYVQYYFLRPKTIFTVSAGIVRGDDKATQAYFREVDKAVAEMKFTEEPTKKYAVFRLIRPAGLTLPVPRRPPSQHPPP